MRFSYKGRQTVQWWACSKGRAKGKKRGNLHNCSFIVNSTSPQGWGLVSQIRGCKWWLKCSAAYAVSDTNSTSRFSLFLGQGPVRGKEAVLWRAFLWNHWPKSGNLSKSKVKIFDDEVNGKFWMGEYYMLILFTGSPPKSVVWSLIRNLDREDLLSSPSTRRKPWRSASRPSPTTSTGRRWSCAKSLQTGRATGEAPVKRQTSVRSVLPWGWLATLGVEDPMLPEFTSGPHLQTPQRTVAWERTWATKTCAATSLSMEQWRGSPSIVGRTPERRRVLATLNLLSLRAPRWDNLDNEFLPQTQYDTRPQWVSTWCGARHWKWKRTLRVDPG